MKKYNITTNELYNDLDCIYDKEANKIDVYSDVYWSADSEQEYKAKESAIYDFSYDDDLVQMVAWCDASGFDYWVVQQEEPNYVSIDVYLKKPAEQYTQQEQQKVSDLIHKWNDHFYTVLT